jgi:hypothetical protein
VHLLAYAIPEEERISKHSIRERNWKVEHICINVLTFLHALCPDAIL